MKRFKRYVMTTATGLLLCAAQAGAELRVIADLGGSDAGRFYEAINRQVDSGTSSPVTALLPQGRVRCCRFPRRKCLPER